MSIRKDLSHNFMVGTTAARSRKSVLLSSHDTMVHVPPVTNHYIKLLVVVVFMSLLTEVTSNTATTAVLLPVIASAGVAAGINPLLVMAPATIAASSAFMMPVATPPNAVVFSSPLVGVPDMVRAGIWLNFLMAGLITLVFQLWVRKLWGIGEALPVWAS